MLRRGRRVPRVGPASSSLALLLAGLDNRSPLAFAEGFERSIVVPGNIVLPEQTAPGVEGLTRVGLHSSLLTVLELGWPEVRIRDIGAAWYGM